MSTPQEPPACSHTFSTEHNGLHYIWRGYGPGKKATSIAVYDIQTEDWTFHPTTGPAPLGVEGGGCAIIGNEFVCFGGYSDGSWFNDLHKLNLETCSWTKVSSKGNMPIFKASCGFVSVDDSTLFCFGGYGKGYPQPGSIFTGSMDQAGHTNEFHVFDLKQEVWSSVEIKGNVPPPCAGFSFTKIDKDRAVLFGGYQPDCHSRVNDLYLINLKSMEGTKVDMGRPWPVERAGHGACCLNYNDPYPQLLVFGGVENGDQVLKDMWLLDVAIGRWTEVTFSQSMKLRCGHSITCSCLRTGCSEVLVFGGSLAFWGDPIAETTRVKFEYSQCVDESPTKKWILVNNDTQGYGQQLVEKKEKVVYYPSSENVHTEPSYLSRMTLEIQLHEAKHNKELAHNLCEDAEKRLVEMDQKIDGAEQKIQEVVTENQRLQKELQKRELRAQIAEEKVDSLEEQWVLRRREIIMTERRILLAENDLDRIMREKQDVEHKLDDKTKELESYCSGLDLEVWKVPSNKVSTTKTIGSGAWGEVLEGNVKVAIKRLHHLIQNQKFIEKFHREMELLAKVRHPNLVQFIGAVFDQSPPYIIIELLDIDLRKAYEKNRLKTGDRLSIFIDIAKALEYLHKRYKPIIHRDVSAPNILLQRMPNNQWKGKVSDLGSANFQQNAQTMGEGAILYSPPEVIPQTADPMAPPPEQSVKIDVYSYGIVLCEVCTSRLPTAEHYRNMILQIQREQPKVYQIIIDCTKKDPNDRPGMGEVIGKLASLKPF